MWSQWYLLQDRTNANGYVVKRYCKLNGKTKWQNLPVKQYKSLSNDEIEALLRRLNASHESIKLKNEERYDFNHAFLNKKVMERFEEHLDGSINDEGHKRQMLSYLRRYTFEFFVIKNKLPDPKTWQRVQDKWGTWLIEQKLSYNTIKQVIFNTNRFLRFLREVVYFDEMPLIKLAPLSRNRLKAHKLKTYSDRYKFINEDKFAEIVNHFSFKEPELLPVVMLCYQMGLRISETLGCQVSDIYEDSLDLKRQAYAFNNGKILTKSLKGLEDRKVPYWFATANDVYSWISVLPKMSPGNLIKRINAELKTFGLESHDFRRSFVTRALRVQHWRDVMRACGHKEMETTLRYDQPLAQTERKLYKPTASQT